MTGVQTCALPISVGQANAAAAGLDINLVPAPVTLNLDGYQIAQALLAYQRQTGG